MNTRYVTKRDEVMFEAFSDKGCLTLKEMEDLNISHKRIEFLKTNKYIETGLYFSANPRSIGFAYKLTNKGVIFCNKQLGLNTAYITASLNKHLNNRKDIHKPESIDDIASTEIPNEVDDVLHKLESNIEKIEESFKNREAILNEREEALDLREKTIIKREEVIKKRRSEARAKEKSIKKREDKLKSKESELKQNINNEEANHFDNDEMI